MAEQDSRGANELSLAEQRAEAFRRISKNLVLEFETAEAPSLDTGALDTGALSTGKETAVEYNRPVQSVDLRGNKFLRTPGVGEPNNLHDTIDDKVFQEMFSEGRVANLDFISQIRPPKPNPENDPLWGIINTPNLKAVLTAIDHVQPQRMLVIGVGTGLDVALYAQAMPEGSELLCLDPGPEGETTFPINFMSSTYQGYGQKNLGRYIKEAEEKGLIGEGSNGAKVTFLEKDSAAFLVEQLKQKKAGGEVEGFDMVVVDGNHAFQAAQVDIHGSWKLLNEGGVLFIDDWNKAFNSGNIMYAAGKLAYEQGEQVFSLEHVANTVYAESGKPANVAFLVKGEQFKREGPDAKQKEALDLACE